MNKKKLTIKELDIENLPDVMALQQKIIAGFNPDEQHFILHRTEEDYKKSLEGNSSHMLGVFDGDELIAQAVFVTPKEGESRDMPEFLPEMSNENLVIYEAILVNPEYRGSGLMKKMLDFIEHNLMPETRTHAIIQIAADNPASWINALHYGMQITKVDCDPNDGAEVIYLEKKLHGVDYAQFLNPDAELYYMHLGQDIHHQIPLLFNKMQYLAENGYIGVALDKSTQSLVWQKQQNELSKTIPLSFILQQKKGQSLRI